MNNEIKELFEKIEALGWSIVKEDENAYFLSKFSPAGQDFSISIVGGSLDDLIDSIEEVYENFDVSEEAYLWLDNTGHGKNGAPYDMRDVLEDMVACEQMILDLYNSIK